MTAVDKKVVVSPGRDDDLPVGLARAGLRSRDSRRAVDGDQEPVAVHDRGDRGVAVDVADGGPASATSKQSRVIGPNGASPMVSTDVGGGDDRSPPDEQRYPLQRLGDP